MVSFVVLTCDKLDFMWWLCRFSQQHISTTNVTTYYFIIQNKQIFKFALVVQQVLTVAVRSSQFHFNLKNEKPKTMTIVKIIHMRQTWDPVTVELYVILCRNSDGLIVTDKHQTQKRMQNTHARWQLMQTKQRQTGCCRKRRHAESIKIARAVRFIFIQKKRLKKEEGRKFF